MSDQISNEIRKLADEAEHKGVPLTLTPKEARQIAELLDELEAKINRGLLGKVLDRLMGVA